MIQAVIFDFFGVISLRGHNAFLERMVPDHAMREELRNLGRQHDLGLLETAVYYQAIATAAKTTVTEVQKAMHSERTLNQPLLDLIRTELKPTYKIGMLSNAGGDLWTFVGRELIDELFDNVLISSDVGMIKPDPRVFELECERLGVQPSEALMIDDVAENCEGARVAGLQSIHYQSFSTFQETLHKMMR